MLRHRRGRRRENAPVGVEPTRTAEAFSASGVGGCASRGAESALPCLGTGQFARLGDEFVQGLVRVLAVAPPVGVGDPAAVGGVEGRQEPGGDLAAALLPHRALDGTRELRALEQLALAQHGMRGDDRRAGGRGGAVLLREEDAERVEHRLEHIGRRCLGRYRVDGLRQPRGDALLAEEEDLALVVAVPEEGALGQPRPLGDVVDRGGVVTPLGEQRERRPSQPFRCVGFPSRHDHTHGHGVKSRRMPPGSTTPAPRAGGRFIRCRAGCPGSGGGPRGKRAEGVESGD